MNLSNQKRIAADVLGIGLNRIVLDPENAEQISEAITREDIRILIHKGIITAKPTKGNSRFRYRKRQIQKTKGRRKGHGKRSGTEGARGGKKTAWMQKVRAIRDELKKMKQDGDIDKSFYRKLYRQVKGNLFKSRRHLREHVKRSESG